MISEIDKYTVKLEEDPETGELILPIPVELLNQMGWDDGDTLLWEEMSNGSYSIKKKEEENG
jgi:hypothetical protein